MHNAKLNRVTGGSEPPDVTTYMENGVQWLRMAKNAEHNERDSQDEPQGFWEWDELCIPSDLTVEQVRTNFDAIWYAGEREAMADDVWRNDIETALLDLMELVLGGDE